MKQALGNPVVIVKYVAVAGLAVTFSGAVIVEIVGWFTGRTVPTEIFAFLTAAVTWMIHQIGLNQGITLVNSETAAAVKTLPQAVAQLQSQVASLAPPTTTTTTGGA